MAEVRLVDRYEEWSREFSGATTDDVNIAFDFIQHLYGRREFDWWWDGIDEETKEEILQELAEAVRFWTG